MQLWFLYGWWKYGLRMSLIIFHLLSTLLIYPYYRLSLERAWKVNPCAEKAFKPHWNAKSHNLIF